MWGKMKKVCISGYLFEMLFFDKILFSSVCHPKIPVQSIKLNSSSGFAMKCGTTWLMICLTDQDGYFFQFRYRPFRMIGLCLVHKWAKYWKKVQQNFTSSWLFFFQCSDFYNMVCIKTITKNPFCISTWTICCTLFKFFSLSTFTITYCIGCNHIVVMKWMCLVSLYSV